MIIFNAYSKVYRVYLQKGLYEQYPTLYSEMYHTYIPYVKGAWCPDFHTYVSVDDPRFILSYEEDEDGVPIETPEHTIAEPWYKYGLCLPDLMDKDRFIGLSRNGYLRAIIKLPPEVKKEIESLDYTPRRELLKRYIGPKKLNDVNIDDVDAWSIRKYGPNQYKQFDGLHLIDFYVIE